MSYVNATKTKAVTPIQEELQEIMTMMKEVTKGPDALMRTLISLRNEMETLQSPNTPSHFRGVAVTEAKPTRNNGSQSISSTNWRTGNMHQTTSHMHQHSQSKRSHESSPRTPTVNSPVPARYQSHFTNKSSLEDKILNEIIGNKLNAFTIKTYDDTRDFIYQIMDSGETQFIREFLEKVFMKATCEDLYCGLFAKLIGEIAHKYPVMYEEIDRYHTEFLSVFDDVEENGSEENRIKNVQKRQYRLGYGHFMSELASLNALSKVQLLAMVEKVNSKLMEYSIVPDKTKTVEEFIDCLIRLIQSLHGCSPRFFASIKEDLNKVLKVTIMSFIDNKPVSVSSKARFNSMDLRDLISC
jgi:hypothetical protein